MNPNTAARRIRTLGRAGPIVRPPVAIALLLALLLLGAPSAGAATYTVTNTSDSGGGSLRQAIADANANPGADTIAFAPGASGQITLADPPGELGITDELTINGSGSTTLAVSGNHVTRIFNVAPG